MHQEAIENQEYTTESDVYSFGIVLYEIVTCGEGVVCVCVVTGDAYCVDVFFHAEPYKGMTNNEVVDHVTKGFQPPRPSAPNCTQEWYQLIVDCVHHDPKARPTFADIIHRLDELTQRVKYVHKSSPYFSCS